MTESRLPSFSREAQHLNLIRKRFFIAAKNVDGLIVAARAHDDIVQPPP
jgi:hypothetical protein